VSNSPGSSEPSSGAGESSPDRRRFLAFISSIGVAAGLSPEVVRALAQDATDVTAAVIAEAEKVAGIALSSDERALMVAGLRANREAFEALRGLGIPGDVAPAMSFDPTPPGSRAPQGDSVLRPSEPPSLPDPAQAVDIAFATVHQLGALLRARAVTSLELTELYLERLTRFGPALRCVVTLTEDLALEQARRADVELAEGRVRGPLHGIPWGAKDLLSTRAYATTWGTGLFREREIGTDAAVVSRLEAAGAVLVAKLSLGALARGDEWFGGVTRNPWRLDEGSSGSSSGSAAATAAGLVGFSIGSETVGSIVSPSDRCGATGLRPTFGRVSRTGAMTLSWTIDKLGPICRSAEDCAIVLAAVNGADGVDRAAQDVPFVWEGSRGLEGIRVGYLESAFAAPGESQGRDRAVLEVLAGLGVDLQAVEFPRGFPVPALSLILAAEAAASFDDLTRSGLDELLEDQSEAGWPNAFRTARLLPAVEYLQASRARTLLMQALDVAWQGVDVIVTPTFARDVLLATNLSGHPMVVVPNGFLATRTPGSISFIGRVWGDAAALHVARAYQNATAHHLARPPRFA
jgi:Asp-tRNA(Asn)/Glu-tRNA(Gln) amidotransferase A subunit family amidase